MYQFKDEPLRSLYLFYDKWTTLFIRKPFWYLISLPRFLRPVRSWTLKRCVILREMTHMSSLSAKVGDFGWPNHLGIEEGAGVNGLWVDPVSDLLFGDVKRWASVAGVDSVRIPAYWMFKVNSTLVHTAAPQPGEKIVMSLHGGGYTFLSAHPRSPTSGIARSLLSYVPSVHRVFSPEYRLATSAPLAPTNPFPAQLIDALAAYNHLVNVAGFDPANIIFEGDSAGGNLVLQLTLYLHEHRSELSAHAQRTGTRALAPPGALLLLSPWVDIGTSHHTPVPSYLSRSDFIMYSDSPDASYSERAVTGTHGLTFADTNRYLSPASRARNAESVPFAGWPRAFIIGGGVERLINSIRTLKERMSADMGEGMGEGRVFYYEAPDAVHDYLTMDFHEPERSETLEKIAEWVEAA